MGTPIPQANVMIYEPEAVVPDMRVGMDLLQHLRKKVNEPYQEILHDLVEKDLIARGDIEDVLQAQSGLEHPFVQMRLAEVPVDRRFHLNAEIYYEAGLIPGSLDTFRQIYERLADKRIQIAFFNAAGAQSEYERLAGSLLVGEFPAVLQAMWVVAENPYVPMSTALRTMIDERKARRKGRTTVTDFAALAGAYSVILTAKPAKRQEEVQDAVDVIYRRLSHLCGAGAL